MCLRTRIELYMKNCLSDTIKKASKVVIGAGSGLSASAGLTYSGKRFEENFAEFIDKFNLPDMYSAGFYDYPDSETFWAYWSKHIYINRYEPIAKDTYTRLLNLVKNKDYFVITTNVDHAFIRSGFDKNRVFYTQGNYGLFQCSKPCSNETHDNLEIVQKMLSSQSGLKIPTSLIPYCPKCGAEMTTNLRKDGSFVQDSGWDNACKRYEQFLHTCKSEKVVYLELGVGFNTPSIIKYPFWQMTYENKKSILVSVDLNEALVPDEIKKRSHCFTADVNDIL